MGADEHQLEPFIQARPFLVEIGGRDRRGGVALQLGAGCVHNGDVAESLVKCVARSGE